MSLSTMTNRATFNITEPQPASSGDGLVSIIGPYQYFLFEVYFRCFFVGIIAVFGVGSNVINLVVYYRQGILSDSCTVSLAGLAVSDFLSCLFVVWGSFCYGIWQLAYIPSIHFDMVCFLSVDGPSLTCTQITCWITAYIALERLISVVFPFKVKLIFSPRRSCALMVIIFLFTILLFIPTLAHSRLEWGQKTPNGSDYLDLVENKGVVDVWLLFEYINGVGFRFASVAIVLLCNVGIFINVNVAKKFRKSASTSSHKPKIESESKKSDGSKRKSDGDERREMRLLKMITIICGMFVVCYATDIAIVFLLGGEVGIAYDWLSRGVWFHCSTLLTTFNSSINIFVYYALSTRYKVEFKRLFNLKAGASRDGGFQSSNRTQTSATF